MPPTDAVEITGSPADPECLHCHLWPVINEFHKAHPNKRPMRLILELAEIIGELAASGCKDLDQLDRVLREAVDFSREKAQECWPSFQLMKRRN